MNKLVIASNNQGKLREFQRMLAPLGIEVLTQAQLGISEAEEPHCTFVENALDKARHVSHASGLPALADDSGICVEALGGAPGVISARYAGDNPKSDARNNEKLLRDMQGVADRRAHYYCVLVLVRHANDPQPLIAEGEWQCGFISLNETRKSVMDELLKPANLNNRAVQHHLIKQILNDYPSEYVDQLQFGIANLPASYQILPSSIWRIQSA